MMKDGKSPNLVKGWPELGGKQAQGKPVDPKTVYEPRVNGVLPEEPSLEFDDITEDLLIPVDRKIKGSGK